MSWDDEEFEVQLPPEAKPAPAAVAESWEDEVDKTLVETPAPVVASGPAAPVQVKAKHLAKERARKADDERAADRAAAAAEEQPPDDPVLRKKWLEERQQAADLALAAAGLGVDEATLARMKAIDLNSISSIVAGVPLGDADSFRELGSKLGRRVGEAGASASGSNSKAVTFFREALKGAAENLSIDDWKDLWSTVNDLKKAADAKAPKAAAAAGGKKAPASAAKGGRGGAGKLLLERDDDYIRGGGEYGAAYDELADEFGGAGSKKATPSAGTPVAAAGAADKPANWRVDDGDFM